MTIISDQRIETIHTTSAFGGGGGAIRALIQHIDLEGLLILPANNENLFEYYI